MNFDTVEQSKELDALIAETVLHWEVWHHSNGVIWAILPDSPWHFVIHAPNNQRAWAPSLSITYAWPVIEALMSRWLPTIFHDGQLWVCELRDFHRKVVACAPTAPLAICRVALKATDFTTVC